MTNKEIARSFRDLADLMELHQENPFKIRSYQNAYITLRKLGQPLSEIPPGEIQNIKGVGGAIAGKIKELLETGKMETLEKYKAMTPEGVQEMLQLKGFGPKKIWVVWKDLGAETIGELYYACNENRLIELKGFGQKTQAELKKLLEYYLKSRNKFHYASLEPMQSAFLEELRKSFSDVEVHPVGEMRRRSDIVEGLDFLVVGKVEKADLAKAGGVEIESEEENSFKGKTADGVPIQIHFSSKEKAGSELFRLTGSQWFLQSLEVRKGKVDYSGLPTEEAVFQKFNLSYIEPELRESEHFIDLAIEGRLPVLIEEKDIQGVVHCHTTYSDGLHSVREMAEAAKEMGYHYIVITDHSKSAFYANGLKEERLLNQWEEIDALDREMRPFRIFKGIESDILYDGSLDYEPDLLARFDCVIASVHSILKMDEAKATQRVIKAVENPYTHILGHPTGRLLLSRSGYPLDHKKVIDACAANKVAIEINANPYRLDLDHTWIPYAMEKQVLLCVNPDAHSREGIRDIHFGVISARKGGLTKEACLNAGSAEAFELFLKKWVLKGVG